jgi:hypothetical protein
VNPAAQNYFFFAAGFFAAFFMAGFFAAFFAGLRVAVLANLILLSMLSHESGSDRIVVQVAS